MSTTESETKAGDVKGDSSSSDLLGNVRSMILEAEQLLSKHDGIHNLHSVVPHLKVSIANGWITRKEYERNELVMRKARYAAKTGSWPRYLS